MALLPFQSGSRDPCDLGAPSGLSFLYIVYVTALVETTPLNLTPSRTLPAGATKDISCVFALL